MLSLSFCSWKSPPPLPPILLSLLAPFCASFCVSRRLFEYILFLIFLRHLQKRTRGLDRMDPLPLLYILHLSLLLLGLEGDFFFYLLFIFGDKMEGEKRKSKGIPVFTLLMRSAAFFTIPCFMKASTSAFFFSTICCLCCWWSIFFLGANKSLGLTALSF